MNELLIRRAQLMEGTGTVDVAIKDGHIVDAGDAVAGSARQMIDAAGRLLIPAFVDPHIHLDTALTLSGSEGNSPEEASEDIKRSGQVFNKSDIIDRGRQLLQKALRHGTTNMRTHVIVDKSMGLRAVEAALELKEEFSGKVDLQVVAMFTGGIAPELLEEALRLGSDGLGGVLYQHSGMRDGIDFIFELAGKYNVFIDLHAEGTNEPSVASMGYIATKTIEHDYQGRVTVTLSCGLAAADEQTSTDTITVIQKAGINVIILPLSSINLNGRQDKGLVCQGITQVRELQAAGVNVACASDHIRDAVRPFGNADMLEEILITAQVQQMGTPEELYKVMKMGTYNAAAAMGLSKYGTCIGDKAELVILDASNPQEAIIGQVEKTCVIKGGRIVLRNDRKTDFII